MTLTFALDYHVVISAAFRYKLAELLHCNVNKFLCDDLTCIDWDQRCDGVAQCGDRSDEYACPSKLPGIGLK